MCLCMFHVITCVQELMMVECIQYLTLPLISSHLHHSSFLPSLHSSLIHPFVREP